MADEKVLPSTEDNLGIDERYSVAWWESRTAEELRDIIKRGFAGGEAFTGAVAESERRASEAIARLRDNAFVEVKEQRKLIVYLAIAVVIAAIVALLSVRQLLS